ncbi:peroxisome biogenesis factor 10 [Coemansia sp. RSA 2708]|nr:peroxisome biogenesis factor 10 [Coemansia sp. RSA 2708]
MSTTEVAHSSNAAEQPQVSVRVVSEDAIDDIARPLSEFKYPFSGQPDIVRSTQKDLFYQQQLQVQISDLVQELKGTRFYAAHQEGIAAVAAGLYYGLTTLVGAPTLGEEYCGIMQIDRRRLYPSLGRRFLMVLLHSAGGWGAMRMLSVVRQWLQRRRLRTGSLKAGRVERILEKIAKMSGKNGLLTKLAMAHLAVFYFTGAYHGLAKRVTGIRYVFTRKLRQGEESAGYEILGALLAIQLVVQSALQLRDWQQKHDTGDGDDGEKGTEDDSDSEATYCWSDMATDNQVVDDTPDDYEKTDMADSASVSDDEFGQVIPASEEEIETIRRPDPSARCAGSR